jgi:hypothetical protein
VQLEGGNDGFCIAAKDMIDIPHWPRFGVCKNRNMKSVEENYVIALVTADASRSSYSAF